MYFSSPQGLKKGKQCFELGHQESLLQHYKSQYELWIWLIRRSICINFAFYILKQESATDYRSVVGSPTNQSNSMIFMLHKIYGFLSSIWIQAFKSMEMFYSPILSFHFITIQDATLWQQLNYAISLSCGMLCNHSFASESFVRGKSQSIKNI